MGIPGMSKPLEAYATSTTIGCKTLGCDRHPPFNGQRIKAVIDGPSFAYCIYHRLIREKPDWLTAVEIVPSYDEVGKGALAFLNELESYGVVIEKIYFDGYLPSHKRSTRLERLETSLRKLLECRQRYVDASICKKKKWNGQQSTSVVLQSASFTPTTFRGLPPATFIVSAILDAICGSKYVAVCNVVPGEAEVYCATTAKETDAIILSNDSDLFVHDLGCNGAFVYLSSADLRANDGNDEDLRKGCSQTIRLSVFRPRDIAERLGLDNLHQLAFEFQKRHSSTLPGAVEAAKRHQDREHEAYQRFLRGYITEPSVFESQQFSEESLARISTHGKFLDPRTSEVICQLESKDQQTVHAYLLCLIEDPARSSAWLVSSGHRYFAYSIYKTMCNDHPEASSTVIVELTRRGQDFVAQEVPLLSHDSVIDFALRLHKQLDEYFTHFSRIYKPVVWRLYALSQVYHWYLNTSRTPPSREALTRAMTGTYKPRPTWDDIHLSAQIQAVLYSLRMIKQILAYTAAATNNPLNQILLGLAAIVEDLPKIPLLMPSSFQLAAQISDYNVDNILNNLAAILQKEAGSTDRGPNHGLESDDDTHDSGPNRTETKHKKSKKKKKKKKKKAAGPRGPSNMEQASDRGKRDNMF